MKRIILIITFLTILSLNGQDTIKKPKGRNIQPTIMVIPRVNEGQDIRTILEDDFNKRIALTKVKEAFDKRNFSTIDFVQHLKNTLQSMAVNSDTKTDIRTQMMQLSGADIIVETEIYVMKTPSGNEVKVILQGIDKYTGQSISNATGESGKFYTDDIAKLTERAVESCIDPFLNIMNTKFSDIVEHGRPIYLEISIDQNAGIDFDTEINDEGDLLSEVIEDWLDENAYNGSYHLGGVTANKMIVDDFRIPLRDEQGRHFRASKIARKLRKYLVNNFGLQVRTGSRSESKISIIIY